LIEILRTYTPKQLKQFHSEIMVAIRRAGLKNVKGDKPRANNAAVRVSR